MRRVCLPLCLLLVLALAGCVAPRPAPPPAAPPAPPAPAHPVNLPMAPDLATWLTSPGTCRAGDGLPADKVVADVVALHNRNGGVTYSLYFGNLAGQKLYVVSPFPDLTKQIHGKTLASDTLRPFLSNRKSLLGDPRCSVGTWYDNASHNTYLDVSVALADKAKAVALGKKYNQISVFDLATMKAIKTGGTGKALPGWPAPLERLPRLDAPMLSVPSAQPVPAT